MKKEHKITKTQLTKLIRETIQEEYNTSGKYPELDEIARDVADIASRAINQKVRSVESAMPYKAQYVLEVMIEILKERV